MAIDSTFKFTLFDDRRSEKVTEADIIYQD